MTERDIDTVEAALRFVPLLEEAEAQEALARLRAIVLRREREDDEWVRMLLRRIMMEPPDLIGPRLTREIREYLGTHTASYPLWDEPLHEKD